MEALTAAEKLNEERLAVAKGAQVSGMQHPESYICALLRATSWSILANRRSGVFRISKKAIWMAKIGTRIQVFMNEMLKDSNMSGTKVDWTLAKYSGYTPIDKHSCEYGVWWMAFMLWLCVYL